MKHMMLYQTKSIVHKWMYVQRNSYWFEKWNLQSKFKFWPSHSLFLQCPWKRHKYVSFRTAAKKVWLFGVPIVLFVFFSSTVGETNHETPPTHTHSMIFISLTSAAALMLSHAHFIKWLGLGNLHKSLIHLTKSVSSGCS